MKFAVQVSAPRTTCPISKTDRTLGDVIETIYPLNTEFALVVWNNVFVPISYKYDVSVIVDDILAMVAAIAHNEFGHMNIWWPSNTFRANWTLAWNATEITIDSHWESVIGGTEALLNAASVVTVEKVLFLAEWGSLLRMLRESIGDCSKGIELSLDLCALDNALKDVPWRGQLYED
jgi:hypothetical protein